MKRFSNKHHGQSFHRQGGKVLSLASAVFFSACLPFLPQAQTDNPLDPFHTLGALMNSVVAPSTASSGGPDVTPPTVTATSPADAYNEAATSTTIAVTFSEAIDSATVSAQTAGGACSGSIQLSSDDFASCIAMSAAAASLSSGNTVATFTPAASLTGGTTYKIRVTASVTDTAGNALSADSTQTTGFTPDATAPTVSNPLSFSGVSSTGLTVTWNASTDAATAQANLQYKLVKDNTATTNIDSVAEADARSGADLLLDWTTATLTSNVSGLSASTTYHFAVLVRDRAGNMALYTPASQATTAAPDTTAPTPGTGPSFSSVASTSMTVSWTAATDAVTAQASLQYKLVKDNSATTNIDTVGEANAKSGGDLLMDWTTNDLTEGVTGLSASTTYHFAVLVRDAAGNMALYGPASQATAATPTNATPTFSPAAGTYTTSQAVTITSTTSGVTICYTTNGDTPAATTPGTCSTGSTLANGGNFSLTSSATVRAIATMNGANNSGVGSEAYTIQNATPTFSPVAGTYSGSQNITITSTTPSATICYTTNGDTPAATTPGTCSTGTSMSSGSSFSLASSATVKAIATKTGLTNSSEASAAYTITTNLVSNPSFESDTSAPPASWTIAIGTLQASTGTITAQSGSNVANFTALTTALSGREALSNCFAISGAQSVTAAGYFYTPDPVGNTEASIGVRYYSDASCSTAVGTLSSTTSALSTQATWQQLTHTKAANGSATHAKVSIRARRLAAGSELIYFDNITAAQP